MVHPSTNVWLNMVFLLSGITRAERCGDLPQFIDIVDIPEDTSPGTVLHSFTMETNGVTLVLEPDDEYLEVLIKENSVDIILTGSLSLNSLNQRSSEPEPSTNEEINCEHNNTGDVLPETIRTELQHSLICTHGERNGRATITIDILAVNEYEPQFFCDPYLKAISEFTLIGTTVFESAGLAYDPDVEGGIFGYEIEPKQLTNLKRRQRRWIALLPACLYSFLIREEMVDELDSEFFGDAEEYSGTIVVTQKLDYDYGIREHVINITVMDSGDPSLRNTTQIWFDILDGDDQDPQFADEFYKLELPEENSSVIGQYFETTPEIFAYDLDFGINATVEYRLLSFEDVFQIDASTGKISAKMELDRETFNSYTVVVEAYQADDPVARTTQAQLIVDVIDVNDNAPEMSNPIYQATVPEHLSEGLVILTVSATDLDIGANAEMDYFLEHCTSSALAIQQVTGHIYVTNNTQLDRETSSFITCKVYAQDKGLREQLKSGTSDVHITLTDINDNSPLFTSMSGYQFPLPVQLNRGDVIGKVTATDKDDGFNAHIVYSINTLLSGENMNYFVIDSATGEISSDVSTTIPGGTQIHLAVEATDGALITTSQRSAISKALLIANKEELTSSTPATASQISTHTNGISTRAATKPSTASTTTHVSTTWSGTEGSVTASIIPTTSTVTEKSNVLECPAEPTDDFTLWIGLTAVFATISLILTVFLCILLYRLNSSNMLKQKLPQP